MKDLIGQFIWIDLGFGNHMRIGQCQVVKATDKQAFVDAPDRRNVRILISEHGIKWWDDEEHAMITMASHYQRRAIVLALEAAEAVRKAADANSRLRELNLRKRHPKEKSDDVSA